ncbi:MAG: preprotein translocase subunit SecG [Proteobacteria bacterium]|nr:preprotein translocase subunit SecG [Pseudomonadota bacterium]
MTVLRYLLLIVEVVVAILLVATVLLQRSKDQGLGLAFGSGMGESLFGAQAVNVLVKITITLAAIFFLNTILLARMFTAPQAGKSVMAGERGSLPAQRPVSTGQQQPISPLPAQEPPSGNMDPVEVPAGTPVTEDGAVAPIEIPAGAPLDTVKQPTTE